MLQKKLRCLKPNQYLENHSSYIKSEYEPICDGVFLTFKCFSQCKETFRVGPLRIKEDNYMYNLRQCTTAKVQSFRVGCCLFRRKERNEGNK